MARSESPATSKKAGKTKKTPKARGEAEAKARNQVAALPVSLDSDGRLRVLLETSRETKRFVIPKGWTEKGMKDWQVAALEAKEEAGLKGRISRKPIGAYVYWKRLPSHFQQVKVKVFVLQAERQMAVWREKGQRKLAWFLIEDAIKLVDEPGMVTLLQTLPKKKLKARSLPASFVEQHAEPENPPRGPDPLSSASHRLRERIGAVAVPPDGTSLRQLLASHSLRAGSAPTVGQQEAAALAADRILDQIVEMATSRIEPAAK